MFRWERLEDGSWLGVDGDNWYQIAVDGPDRPLVSVSRATGANRDPSRDALARVAEPRAAYSKEADRFHVRSNGDSGDFAAFFRLDWDADEVEREIVARGPELEPYLAATRGLRLLRPSDAVETFFCFVCTPNNNLPRIVQMVRHLAAYGPALGEAAGSRLHRWPEPETIAAISDPELRAKGFGYRAATIPEIARSVVERGGRAWVESLRDVPYSQAHSLLCEIKGIGPKLADCICLFALDHTEAVPVDTHLWQAATRLYFPEWQGTSLTTLKYQRIGDFLRSRFGHLTGWAHQCLFYDNLLNWRSRQKPPSRPL